MDAYARVFHEREDRKPSDGKQCWTICPLLQLQQLLLSHTLAPRLTRSVAPLAMHSVLQPVLRLATVKSRFFFEHPTSGSHERSQAIESAIQVILLLICFVCTSFRVDVR